MMTVYLVELLVMLFSLAWAIVHFRELKKKDRLKPNLSTVGLTLSCIGYILRIIYLVMPSRGVWGNVEPTAVTLTTVVLVYFVTCIWLTTGMLAIGFWHDALTRKLNSALRPRTKYVIFSVSVIVLLLTVTGMVLILNRQIVPGTMCVLVPLFVVIIVMIIFTIKIKRIRGKFSPSNAMRKKWVERIITVLCIVWSIYFLALILHPIISMTRRPELLIIPSILYRLLEALIAPLLVAIFDTQCVSLRIVFGCATREELDRASTTGSSMQKVSSSTNTPMSSTLAASYELSSVTSLK